MRQNKDQSKGWWGGEKVRNVTTMMLKKSIFISDVRTGANMKWIGPEKPEISIRRGKV
jgi:hypothetical protein